ncbi:M50 family metallopeptidase [Microvirga tunisiensis]|uniref:Site-2 protease family protein n=1 Tax=Microvirga tunisiensis TaxID=2108360 RepID=A0A5N7MC56_9HYPH|nr:M50 family metallopeptidase [Microvirga tunisiensis]MPR05639.1 site-2 protease family protein [Microvirga tunisiensis]MPR23839.1 site-2 protease family protein [Microvirga tunisiensis]
MAETILITILPFLFIMTVVVTIHEAGHYWVARWLGIKVEEFSIGFGPLLRRDQGKHNLWTIRALPLGGYVRFAETGEKSFRKASGLSRITVAFAGPSFNILASFVFFVAVFYAGLTWSSTTILATVPGSGAQLADIHPGDRIVSINGVAISSVDDLYAASHFGDPDGIDRFQLDRSGSLMELDVLKADGKYGLVFNREHARSDLPKSFVLAMKQMVSASVGIFNIPALVYSMGGNPIEVFSGPVGIAHVTGKAVQSEEALLTVLLLLAHLNLGLALVNLLPVPLFDGGRILLYAIESCVKKPASRSVENALAGISVAVIAFTGILVTWSDLQKIILLSFPTP